MENRNRWDSTGTYLGNYTDTCLSLGLNLDLPNLDIDLPAQPPHRAVCPLASLYNTQVGMAGWVNHVGAGVTLRF